MIVHVFTHAAGFIESFDLVELQNTVSSTGFVGEYSTREHVEPVEPVEDITVTTYQAKAALAIAGRYDEVDAYMRLDTTDRITKLKWEYASFKRSDPSVLAIGAALGMSAQDLDDLFALAQTIT
jgi:hypothetical protein